MNIKERIHELAKARGISIPRLEEELKLGNGTISRWSKSSPSVSKLLPIANYFNVSIDYLIGNDTTIINNPSTEVASPVELTKKDERDIQKRLQSILNDLNSESALAFYNGEQEMDEETKELLKISLEQSIRTAKIRAKEKFTPKKFKKD